MVRSCSIPNCTSGSHTSRRKNRQRNIPEVSMFLAPKQPNLFEEWNKALRPVLKRQLTSKDTICALHFKPTDIMTSFETVMPDGTVNRIPRSRPALRPRAVPISSEARNESPKLEEITAQEEETVEIEVNCEPLVVISDDDEGLSDTRSVIEWEEERLSDMEVSFRPEYDINQLKEDLKTTCLPEFWSYARCGHNVLFHLLDPYSLSTKLRLIIDEEMKFTATLADGTITMDMDGEFTSTEEIVKSLRKTTYIKVCAGTELEEESRDIACPGFMDSENMYKRRQGVQRCIPCRALRNRLKTKYNQSRSGLKRGHRSCGGSSFAG